MAPLFQHIRTRIKKQAKKVSGAMHRSHDVALVTRMRKRRIPTFRQVLCIGSLFTKKQKVVFVSALTVFVISLLIVGETFTGRYQVSVPAVKGSYTEGVIGGPQLMNPLYASLNEVDQDIVSLVYSGLMRYDETRHLVPDLAVKYEVSEDNKTYTFTLKENVRWHDNEKFDADDVVYTFETLKDTSVNSPLALGFQNVGIEKLDEYTVQFTLAEPFPSFLTSFTVGILPEHIWSAIPNSQLRLANRNVNPIGTGPFAFKELFKDTNGYIHRVEFVRFENFYRSAPYIKDFAFEYFNDYDGPTGVIEALREKKIDGVHFVPYELRDKVKRKHINLYTLQLPQYTALFFNVEKTGLKKLTVRQGLVEALDRERIVSEVLENEARVIESPLLEGFPGFREDVEGYTFSIEESNALLDKEYTRISSDEYRALLKEEKLHVLIDAETARLQAEQDTTTSEEVVIDEQSSSTDTVVDEETTPVVAEQAEVSEKIDMAALEKIVEDELDRDLDAAQLFYRYPKGGDDKKDVFEIDLVTVSRPEYIKVAEIVAGYWQDVGIKVTVNLVDAKDLSRQVLKERSYDVLLYGVIVGNDPDQYPFWHSTQTVYPGLNLSQYKNSDVDKILEKIRNATTDEEQATLYSDLQDTIIEDIPAAFLYTPTYTYALTDAIKGFDTTRISRPSDRFSDVTNWYIATKQVWQFNK